MKASEVQALKVKIISKGKRCPQFASRTFLWTMLVPLWWFSDVMLCGVSTGVFYPFTAALCNNKGAHINKLCTTVALLTCWFLLLLCVSSTGCWPSSSSSPSSSQMSPNTSTSSWLAWSLSPWKLSRKRSVCVVCHHKLWLSGALLFYSVAFWYGGCLGHSLSIKVSCWIWFCNRTLDDDHLKSNQKTEGGTFL